MTAFLPPVTGAVLVPIGMKHAKSRRSSTCLDVVERYATEFNANVLHQPNGSVCQGCGLVVTEDDRPVVLGALQVIDAVLDDEGRCVTEIPVKELQAMVDLFEQGAKWLASQQDAHLQDLGLEMVQS